VHLHLGPARRSIAIQLSVGDLDLWICVGLFAVRLGPVRFGTLTANFQVQCGDFSAWGPTHTNIHTPHLWCGRERRQMKNRIEDWGICGRVFGKSDPFSWSWACVVPMALGWICTRPNPALYLPASIADF